MSLSSKVALVTGGSRGIGLGIAAAFAQRGAQCILVGRNDQTLREAIETLEGDSRHTFYAGDVGQSQFWTDHDVSRVDILVNAAGISHFGPFQRLEPSVVESVLRTNLLGTIYGCQAVTRSMVRRKNGRIINISSALAYRFGKGSTVYAASKAGIHGFTKALAQELGPFNIDVNAIAPGYIDTDMVASIQPTRKDKLESAIAKGRFGCVDDIAQAALFLATSNYTTGTTLTVDGGTVYE